MHAADTAGGENRDLGQMSGDHRRGNRCGAGAPRGDAGRHIGARQFRDILGLRQCRQLVILQPDVQPSVDHSDGGGDRTGLTHIRLDLTRDL